MVLRCDEIGVVTGDRICMRIVPVDERKLQSEPKTVLSAGLGKFPYEVPVGSHHLNAAV